MQPDGHAAKEFLLDWQPFGAPATSYGHDPETAWLLLETAATVGRPEDPAARAVARRVGEAAARTGFDARAGGYFEEGVPFGAPDKLEKIWWIQAEAIPSLFRLWALGGGEVDLERLERTLDFIESKQRDREHGGLFWGIAPDGSVGPHGGNKGEEWKASYHELRALVLTTDWIRAALGDDPRPARVTAL